MQDAEQRRRKLIADEEQKLMSQRTRFALICLIATAALFISSEAVFAMFFCRLAAMNRELKLKDLQLMDATRRKFLEYQQQQKEMELARMDDEIRRKVR